MIIINSLDYQSTSINACTLSGSESSCLFLIGPSFVKTVDLPLLGTDGLWRVTVSSVKNIEVIKISGRLYFKSKLTQEILPGQFVFDSNNELLIIKPYD